MDQKEEQAMIDLRDVGHAVAEVSSTTGVYPAGIG
jgi:hypothetical protein